HTAQKLAAVFAGKKFGTDHRRRRIYSRANINNFFGSSMTLSISITSGNFGRLFM
ncbi:MAG: hypothetical protein ACI9KK_002701, partial [Ascidiaceihabitans sp.]